MALQKSILLLALFLTGLLSGCNSSRAQLSVSFGEHGLKQLSYQGTVLESTDAFAADRFHVWHMKVTDLQGNIQKGPGDGWGENSTNKTWDSSAKKWTYQFDWGSISTQVCAGGRHAQHSCNGSQPRWLRQNPRRCIDLSARAAFPKHADRVWQGELPADRIQHRRTEHAARRLWKRRGSERGAGCEQTALQWILACGRRQSDLLSDGQQHYSRQPRNLSAAR